MCYYYNESVVASSKWEGGREGGREGRKEGEREEGGGGGGRECGVGRWCPQYRDN